MMCDGSKFFSSVFMLMPKDAMVQSIILGHKDENENLESPRKQSRS